MSETSPEISVVMGVYNSADSLERTLDSVLGQVGVTLEFVVINDGSTDGTAQILDRRAALDSRLVVVHQENAGLTVALQRGCDHAKAEFIARQDAGGDVSLPDRFRLQLEQLRTRPDAVMVSCGTRFVGPDDEFLYDVVVAEKTLDDGLHTLRIPGLAGPSSHASCLFRSAAYHAVGGYRAAFVVAQDMDLWLRLVERGRCVSTSDVLYQSRQALGSISSRMRSRQFELGALAVESARCRRHGTPEPDFSHIDTSRPYTKCARASSEVADFHFFVGACVGARDSKLARQYYFKALKAQPFHARTWWRLLTSTIRR